MPRVTIQTTPTERATIAECDGNTLPKQISAPSCGDAIGVACDMVRIAQSWRSPLVRLERGADVLEAVAARLEGEAHRVADATVGGDGPAGLKALFS